MKTEIETYILVLKPNFDAAKVAKNVAVHLKNHKLPGAVSIHEGNRLVLEGTGKSAMYALEVSGVSIWFPQVPELTQRNDLRERVPSFSLLRL